MHGESGWNCWWIINICCPFGNHHAEAAIRRIRPNCPIHWSHITWQRGICQCRKNRKKVLRKEELQPYGTFRIPQGAEDWWRTEYNDTFLYPSLCSTWNRTRPTTNDDLHCGLIVRKDQSCSRHNAEVTEGQRNSKRLIICPFIQKGTGIYEK